MARPNRFQIMELYKQDIVEVIGQNGTGIVSRGELRNVFNLYRDEWRLPQVTTYDNFEGFLLKHGIISKIDVHFSDYASAKVLFSIKKHEIDTLKLALLLHPDSYISHYTAAFMHDLTQNIVKSIYVNKEQYPKVKVNNGLSQDRIDTAMSKNARSTNNWAEFEKRRIYFLNGKHTDNLGVINSNEDYRIINIEGQLVNIAVRPNYFGGVNEVLKIYKNAKSLASVNRIYSILKRLNHIYPYHQVIGFYLERAGYRDSAVD